MRGWQGQDEAAEAEELDWDKLLIKGTSTALEKQYLRLTSVSHVRTVFHLNVVDAGAPSLDCATPTRVGEIAADGEGQMEATAVRVPLCVRAVEEHSTGFDGTAHSQCVHRRCL